MKHGLVDNWRTAWRWLSVQIGVLLAASQEIYEQLQISREFIPPALFHHLMAGLAVLLILCRLKKQEAKNDTGNV